MYLCFVCICICVCCWQVTVFDVSGAKHFIFFLLLLLQINSYLAPVSCKNLLLSILQKIVFLFIVYVLYVAGMCQSKGNISLRRQHFNQWATCQNNRHVASWAKCAAPQVNFTFSLSAKQEWHNKQFYHRLLFHLDFDQFEEDPPGPNL